MGRWGRDRRYVGVNVTLVGWSISRNPENVRAWLIPSRAIPLTFPPPEPTWRGLFQSSETNRFPKCSYVCRGYVTAADGRVETAVRARQHCAWRMGGKCAVIRLFMMAPHVCPARPWWGASARVSALWWLPNHRVHHDRNAEDRIQHHQGVICGAGSQDSVVIVRRRIFRVRFDGGCKSPNSRRPRLYFPPELSAPAKPGLEFQYKWPDSTGII